MANLKTVNLGNLAANGSTPGLQITGAHRNATASVNVRTTGDLDGGTVTYEGSIDDVTYYPLGDNAVLSDEGGAELRVLAGEFIRATLAGAGGAPNIDNSILLPGTAEV